MKTRYVVPLLAVLTAGLAPAPSSAAMTTTIITSAAEVEAESTVIKDPGRQRVTDRQTDERSGFMTFSGSVSSSQTGSYSQNGETFTGSIQTDSQQSTGIALAPSGALNIQSTSAGHARRANGLGSGHSLSQLRVSFETDTYIQYTLEASVAADGAGSDVDVDFEDHEINVSSPGQRESKSFAETGVLPPGGRTLWLSARSGPTVGGSSFAWDVRLTIEEAPQAIEVRAEKRYGLDADRDGFIDQAQDAAFVDPVDGYVRDLTWRGCPADVREIVWRVDHVEVARGFSPALCTLRTKLHEGVRKVFVEAREIRTGDLSHAFGQDVVIQDWLIFSLGDSVASGEGVPDSAGPGRRWINHRCHRSASAGPSVAAIQLENLDPATSVTFVSLACSGASMAEGMLGGYWDTVEEKNVADPIPPQIETMGAIAHGREIDAVLISIGANDVKFSKIVQDCFVYGDSITPLPISTTPECHVPNWPLSSKDFFEARAADLPLLYELTGERIANQGVASDRTYITEYFDPTRDANGAFCGRKILEESLDVPGFGISEPEIRWAGLEMLPRLDLEVSRGAAANDWTYIGGIFDTFTPHGYCAADRYVVQLTESLLQQGDEKGTLHPNEAGHSKVYAPAILSALRADLYTGGDIREPREPA